ncbi:Zn-dependent protease [Leptolyngbya sp. 'hensonii']|uniref:TldD/PmbA family protein n=1 Tax=Leptolyngbya sp. 'hensonii' TaxID=1922337 RepID=UPI00094F8946|nr:TldD/PmbA family protein [Leptolyngbya sp. 'hensonii']OLP16412.1 Zn-dependent protease [Leptolyngbya sp. 'hensonii']
MLDQLSQVLASLDLPVDWVGLRAVRETETTRSFRDGLPRSNGRSDNQGVMVEVLVNGQIGYGATNSFQAAPIRLAAQMAYQQAKAAAEWGIHRLTETARPKVTGQYISPFLKPLEVLSAGEINDLLAKICQTLKVSDQIVQTTAMVMTTEAESWLISSNGSEVYQKFLKMATDYGATAQDGAIVQRRTQNGWLSHCYQGGAELFPEPDLWERVRRTGEQAVELLAAEDCPTMTTTLVLAPDQMMLQIHESIGHPLELDRILGDERNYAGGSFVKPEDFGQLTYGSPLMNVTFDPTVPGELASYNFDDTGTPASREYLIQGGKLLRGIGGLESQTRSGLPGVACTRACSWNRPPIDRMANLNLEPGTTPLAELIGSIEQGVYMESNRSWSIDDQRYKFQFGCEYARLIEQGQLTKTLRNPNYRGTTLQFWQNLVQVGDQESWAMYGTPMCGKGEPNQAIWVGHGSPICAFANLEVFGGG